MIKFSSKKTIIWDWNGTLLDDADYCVKCMNKVLSKRKIPQIDIDRYREVFTFPVREYYKTIGFNLNQETFEIPAMEFIDHYYSGLNEVNLQRKAKETLLFFKKLGFKQFVLSAMEHSNLINSLTDKGLVNYFDEVSGINNHYAHSKLEMGIDLVNKIGITLSEILLIGDTIHDFEVASGLGVDCILVANGHQSKKRLLQVTTNVISTLDEIIFLLQE
jgi:phosphoglycolate phosphatase